MRLKKLQLLGAALAAALVATPVFADKPDWAGKGKGKLSPKITAKPWVSSLARQGHPWLACER